MASGHVNRANRPNTWLLRPLLHAWKSSFQPGAVHMWPIATGHILTAGVALGALRTWTDFHRATIC